MRITKSGIVATYQLIKDFQNNNLKLRKQKKNNFKVFKRRKYKQSEIILAKISSKSFLYLNNHIRMLDDPYPNAFVNLDNKKICIKKIKKNKKFKKYKKYKYLNSDTKVYKNLNGYLINLKDTNARIIESYKC